jgi:hypothetical protein
MIRTELCTWMNTRLCGKVVAGATGALLFIGPPAMGQTTVPAPQAREIPSSGIPERDNLMKMGRAVTIKFEEQRLEEVMDYLATLTGADLEVLWRDERNADGLDPEQTVTLKVENVSALTLLEKVLERAQTEDEENSWQLSKYGSLQVGPKSRLNKYKRTEIYDINDLLVELPRYDEVPAIDLQSVLQSGQGGGGQSPFRDDQDEEEEDRKTLDEKADEIVAIIQKIVETQQWTDNGGDAASIDRFRSSIIITAPDYIHRQINGYTWWPSAQTTSGMAGGRRWVSLNLDTGLSHVDGFGQQEVSAVVGGEIIRSGDPGR